MASRPIWPHSAQQDGMPVSKRAESCCDQRSRGMRINDKERIGILVRERYVSIAHVATV